MNITVNMMYPIHSIFKLILLTFPSKKWKQSCEKWKQETKSKTQIWIPYNNQYLSDKCEEHKAYRRANIIAQIGIPIIQIYCSQLFLAPNIICWLLLICSSHCCTVLNLLLVVLQGLGFQLFTGCTYVWDVDLILHKCYISVIYVC